MEKFTVAVIKIYKKYIILDFYHNVCYNNIMLLISILFLTTAAFSTVFFPFVIMYVVFYEMKWELEGYRWYMFWLIYTVYLSIGVLAFDFIKGM